VNKINLSFEDKVQTFVSLVVVLDTMLFLAAWGFRSAPIDIQRAARVLPLYAVLILAFAIWSEVRLWLTTYPILIPLAVSGIIEQTRTPHLQ
jgi:hypothetical protein